MHDRLLTLDMLDRGISESTSKRKPGHVAFQLARAKSGERKAGTGTAAKKLRRFGGLEASCFSGCH